jgi:hypothetical protein
MTALAGTGSLIGRWYATGPADRPFDAADPAFNIHRVVADDHALPGCVTIRNAAGQEFPLDRALAARIAIDVDPDDWVNRARA